MRDTVYQQKPAQSSGDIVDFAFNEDVVAVFPDMIRRSVPGYETMIPITGLLAARALGEDGVAFDLGCSLGATSQAILAQNRAPDIKVVGIDNASAMIDGAKQANQDARAEFVLGNVEDTSVQGARVVVLNLVLQFLPPEERLSLLTRLQSEMEPGGLLLLSEKVTHEDDELRDFYDTTHLSWKEANGYSSMEVSRKRSALENVMRIDSEETHLERLQLSGFTGVTQWYRCLNWASFVAYA